MEIHSESVIFRPDPAMWKEFTESPTGTVGSDLRKRGRRLVILARGSVQKKTGAVAKSIGMEYVAVPNPFIRVGSSHRHALILHNGTKPHWIGPDHEEVLKFRIKGRIIYTRRVHHPGTRGSFYLTRHLRKVV